MMPSTPPILTTTKTKVCPTCARPFSTPRVKKRRARPLVLSESQRRDIESLSRFDAVTRRQLAIFNNETPEAVRCRGRRSKDRGLVEVLDDVPGGFAVYRPTPKALSLIGVADKPRELGHAALFVRLAIAEYATLGAKVLNHAEFHDVLARLEPTLGPLRVQGLPRRRWAAGGKALQFLHVDLTNAEMTATKIVARLSERARKLAKKSEGWKKLVAAGFVGFIVLTPWARAADIEVAAQRAKLTVETVRIPLLRHALGLGEESNS